MGLTVILFENEKHIVKLVKDVFYRVNKVNNEVTEIMCHLTHEGKKIERKIE